MQSTLNSAIDPIRWVLKEKGHMIGQEFEDKLERQLRAAGFDFEPRVQAFGLCSRCALGI